jgi:3-oxoadipate enol-lactonase
MRNAGQNPLAEDDVEPHLLELIGSQRTRLQQHRVPDPDLAEIVEQEAVLQLGLVGELRGDALGQCERKARNALGVSAGLIVTKLERGGECEDSRGIRLLELRKRRFGGMALGSLGPMELLELLGVAKCLLSRKCVIHVPYSLSAREAEWFSAAMTDLWYDVTGSGPPAVLLHESVVDSRIWAPFLPYVEDRLTAIRYDQRGYGRSPLWDGPYSPVEDLVSVLDEVGVGKAALVGTSHGGRIAIQAALERPERVSALVLAGSGLAGHPLEIEGTPEQEARWEAAEAAGDVNELAELDLEIWAPMGVDDELRAMFVENAETSNAEDPRIEQPSVGRLSEIVVPTLVITGGRDVPAINEVGDLLAREIPGAKRAVIEEADHMIQWRAPEELAHLVVSFLS